MRDFGITRIDDGDRLVGGLSGGERQSLAIARAVHFGARVLILDEPTAALGVKQAAHVLRIINEAKRRGLAVIFITHQVMHAMAVGDHFAVLIRGAIAADFRRGEKPVKRSPILWPGARRWPISKPRSMHRNDATPDPAEVRPSSRPRLPVSAAPAA
ncbi:ATP-binding cassette domain-containing protein [Gemmobacter lanyuensis]